MPKAIALRSFTSRQYEGAVTKGDTLDVTAARLAALVADGRAEAVKPKAKKDAD